MSDLNAVTRTVISDPDEQTALWFLGALAQVRLGGEQTDGAYSLVENLVRRGTDSPVHVHDREDETFFVLDGEQLGSRRRPRWVCASSGRHTESALWVTTR